MAVSETKEHIIVSNIGTYSFIPRFKDCLIDEIVDEFVHRVCVCVFNPGLAFQSLIVV